jgi:poly [ADP-ribose] polymerase
LKSKVKTIYRVVPKKQKVRFNEYLAKNNIRTVKELWHGSRNENWLSIILNGLLLNPNAQITGKMFGNGIYFANSSDKSYGYTDGGRWNNGYSNTKFMGLYAVAYGNPLKWTNGSHFFDKTEVKSRNCDCVHALGQANGGNILRADEIVFYDENAMLLNYIVEFDD